MSKILCVFHGKCADGLGALWAVVRRFGMENVEPFAGFYGRPAPDVTGRKVVMVDFSYSRDVMEDLVAKAESFICLDHHESARDALAGIPGCHFDMTRSGAVMAWEHFMHFESCPLVLRYIGDRDIWAWKMPSSREVSEVMQWDFSVSIEDQLAQVTANQIQLERDFPSVVLTGTAIRTATERLVKAHAGSWFWVTVRGGKKIPACFCHPILASETGNVLAAMAENPEGVSVCLSAGHDGKYALSFRAVNGTAKDLALAYGGGGHPNAAGAGVDLDGFNAILATREARPKD